MGRPENQNSITETAAFGAVILGAGASSRMGRPKLLLPWHDTTVIGQLIRQWRQLGARQIAVVHRPGDSALSAELDRLDFPAKDRIENPHPERGMFSSIQCAANWKDWNPGIRFWAIVLGDQPHLRPESLQTLLAFQRNQPDAICQPECEGRGGHPVLLPWRAFEALKLSQEESLKNFLKQTSCQSVKCSINDPVLSLDMDTPADYIRLHNLLNP